MSTVHYDWSPLSMSEVARLFHNLPISWWIAGGVALELFVGSTIRKHEDLDVGVFRGDQLIMQDYLSGWDLHEASASKLKPWMKDKFLAQGVNQVWCRRTPDSAWALEIMFMEHEGAEWFFRRAPQVRGLRSQLIRQTVDGFSYLSPEIQLLFKARPVISPKDALDFHTVLPFLDATQRMWLQASLKATFPGGHPWIDILGAK
jgi:hypothetical protein